MVRESDIVRAAQVTIQQLLAHKVTLATAESMTAGGFHYYCVKVPDCSTSMLGGAVVYSPASKKVLADVPQSLLDEFGTVAPETTLAIASGIRARLHSDIGMGVTGYAGPKGGTEEHPVGRVYWALIAEDYSRVTQHDFDGEREDVVNGALLAGFELLREFLAERYGVLDVAGEECGNGGS